MAWTEKGDPFKSNTPAAVVYPGSAVNSYAVVRSLGPRGVPVILLHWRPTPLFASRWVTPVICPDPDKDPEAFVDFLVNLGGKLRKPAALYMMNDLYAYLAAVNRDRLKAHYLYSFQDQEILDKCLDKQAMHNAAVDADVYVPDTWFPDDDRELCELKSELKYPAIIKPRVARFTYDGKKILRANVFPKIFGTKGLMARNFDELAPLFDKVHAHDIKTCIQHFIPGGAELLYTVNLVTDFDSVVRGAYCGHKIRQWPPDFGTITLGRAENNDEMVELARRFVTGVRYVGMGGLEFKVDPETRRPYFIEINPRDGIWTAIAVASGVDLPYLCYRIYLGDTLEGCVRQDSKHRRWYDLRADVARFLLGSIRNPSHPLDLKAWAMSLLRGGPFVEAVLNCRDPLPGLIRLGETGYLAAKTIVGRFKGKMPGQSF